MEEDRSPHSQPSDKSTEDTANVDDEKETSTSQLPSLADSVDTIRLDTQAMDFESLQLESSSKKSQDSVLNENLRDLDYVVLRIESLLQFTISNPIPREELIPWPVYSALLRAMFNISTQRQVGAALMQYVDELRRRTNLMDILEKHPLKRYLTKLVRDLKKIAICENSRNPTSASQQESDRLNEQDLIETQKKVILDIFKKYQFYKKHRIVIEQDTFKDIVLQLFSTDAVNVEEGQIKSTIESLHSASFSLSSTVRLWISDPSEGISPQVRMNLKVWVKDIIKLARGLQLTCKEHEKNEIEAAVREVLLQTLNLLDISALMEKYRNRSPARRILKRDVDIEDVTTLTASGGDISLKRHPRSPSPPASRKSYSVMRNMLAAPVCGIAVAAVGGMLVGPLATGIIAVGASSAFLILRDWWNPLREEQVETQVEPAVTSGSFTPVECVATPFSDPVYLKGGGSSSGGGGGGDDGDDGGGGGGGDGGDNREGEGSRMPDRDPGPEYHRRYLDACRSLTDAINDLCRITSQINGIQNDCREMLSKLGMHEAMLQCGQPTSALSYAECVKELLNLRESIALLNNDQPMVRIEYFRNLRYVVSIVCKSLDLAAQCGYLLTLLDGDQKAAKVGVVDVKQLKKIVEEAQFTCYKMLQLSPELAREEAVQLRRQIDVLLDALSKASKRTLNMRERIEQAVIKLRQNASSLHATRENLLLVGREHISSIILLLYSIKEVGKLTEDPKIVPIAANTNDEARERRYDVLKNAKNLHQRVTILIHDAMTHENLGVDSRTLTWNTGRDVTREFEELVLAVRKNGISAGFIEDQLPEVPMD